MSILVGRFHVDERKQHFGQQNGCIVENTDQISNGLFMKGEQ